MRDWRALNGPDREVYFEQEHPPGREAQMDFTHCGELGVTIGGEPFPHLMFQFVLSHSGWRYAEVAYGETFTALVSGLQGALWELGGVPEVVRTDNLSAATHELKDSKGRAFNERYQAILDHYGLKATRTNPRSSRENGVAEQGHPRLKDSIAQALVLRGSSDFESVERYTRFVRSIVDRRNRLVRGGGGVRVSAPAERCLPAPVPEYVGYRATVRKWSTIRVNSRTYSVPSRLICVTVDVRLYPDHIEVYYKGHLVESMERIRGKVEARIDYRHIIGSLVRKPGAFARYRFREQMYPSSHLPAGVRRYARLEGRASRRGLCAHPAPCRDNDGSRRREGAQEAACVESEVRLRRGEASGRTGVARRYRTLSCPARWTLACTTGCSREVRDDDGHLRAKRSRESASASCAGSSGCPRSRRRL